MARIHTALACGLFLFAACSSDNPVGDLDAMTDAAGDAGVGIDGAVEPDLGTPTDGATDTGTSTNTDGGVNMDSGTSTTADGGLPTDAGPGDSGRPDSGVPGLGEACTDNGDCASGYCFLRPNGSDGVCSNCANNGDCNVQQDCDFDQGDGYASCVGTGDLGDSCADNGQCVSGICNGNVCSECAVSQDCPAGGMCEDDTAGVGYFVCTGGLGDVCMNGTDCGLGYCYNPPVGQNRCSECEDNGDCGVQRECDYSFQRQFAVCVGTGGLGDSCSDDNQCESEICNGNVCSECAGNQDCGNGQCFDDTAGSGYWVCLAGLGENCNAPTQCASGFCFNPPGIGPNLCSECQGNGDCGQDEQCDFNNALGYARCVGTQELGEACMQNAECESLYCNSSLCSECVVDGDCAGGGTCTDDTQDSGYFICTAGLGDGCAQGTDCNSGFCFAGQVCSECETTPDCMSGFCLPNLQIGYATCR